MRFRNVISVFVVLVTAVLLLGYVAFLQPEADTSRAKPDSTRNDRAIFAGGCFWGLQAAFDELPGVVRTRAGYTGGHSSNPNYEDVVTGQTGHAEAVEVTFDPGQISYEQLVRYFFAHHRYESNEPDSKYQMRPYRSEIFVHDASQRATAEKIIAELSAHVANGRHVTTLIGDAGRFWEAEVYHQKYLAQCGR